MEENNFSPNESEQGESFLDIDIDAENAQLANVHPVFYRPEHTSIVVEVGPEDPKEIELKWVTKFDFTTMDESSRALMANQTIAPGSVSLRGLLGKDWLEWNDFLSTVPRGRMIVMKIQFVDGNEIQLRAMGGRSSAVQSDKFPDDKPKTVTTPGVPKQNVIEVMESWSFRTIETSNVASS